MPDYTQVLLVEGYLSVAPGTKGPHLFQGRDQSVVLRCYAQVSTAE